MLHFQKSITFTVNVFMIRFSSMKNKSFRFKNLWSVFFSVIAVCHPAKNAFSQKNISALIPGDFSNVKTNDLQISTDAKVFVMGGQYGLMGGFNMNVMTTENGSSWHDVQPNAPWGRRFGPNCVYFDDKIFMMAGLQSQGPMKNDVWSTPDGINWTELTSQAAWGPRFGSAAVAYDNKLWIMGGIKTMSMFGSYTSNDVWSSPDGINWTHCAQGAAMWTPREGHSAVVFQNKIWVLGGMNIINGIGIIYDEVWTTTDGTNWTQMPNAPWYPRMDHRAVVFDNKIWIMGGEVYPFHNDVWWTADGMTWTEATAHAPWKVRSDFDAYVMNGKMWVAGGIDSSYSTHYNDIWSSTDGTNWTHETDYFTANAHGVANQGCVVTPPSFGLPDLEVMRVSPFQNTLYQSTTDPYLLYEFTVRNSSLVPVTVPVTAKFSLYKLDGPGHTGLAGSMSLASPMTVAPGQIVTMTGKSRGDIGLRSMAGSSNYALVADDTDVIEEGSETNNSYFFSITIVQ